MDSLVKGMMGNFSDDLVGMVAKQAGVDPKMAQAVLEKMTPAMTGAMAQNTKTTQGAQDLSDALDKHDGSIFGNFGSMNQDELEQDGSKILGHVFGNKSADVQRIIMSETGADPASAKKVMSMMAPLVLGSLGEQKKSKGIDKSALAGMLGGAAKSMAQDKQKRNMVLSMMDLDKDGGVIDDIPKILGFIGIAKKFLGGGKG